MCFVFIWEQTATCATYSINGLVFITEMKSVYSAVRTGSLNKAVCASYLKGLIREPSTSGFLLKTCSFGHRYTVRLLSFRTGIIKSICVKEITLLLSSFRHTSLLTVHTDLHDHSASGCLCRTYPMQWCLMYLSRLSGCPKSSQRDAPSSGISIQSANEGSDVVSPTHRPSLPLVNISGTHFR